MSESARFMIYCLERYRFARQLSGKEVIALFRQYKILEYLMNFYPVLHITGDQYIINDIDEYIREQQKTRPDWRRSAGVQLCPVFSIRKILFFSTRGNFSLEISPFSPNFELTFADHSIIISNNEDFITYTQSL
ncbi:MAG: DUF3791 domain-containing protein [Planctomycetia bacterium]|nr:DUF3791 domain-containing protein [Planctomycetia bacterium]